MAKDDIKEEKKPPFHEVLLKMLDETAYPDRERLETLAELACRAHIPPAHRREIAKAIIRCSEVLNHAVRAAKDLLAESPDSNVTPDEGNTGDEQQPDELGDVLLAEAQEIAQEIARDEAADEVDRLMEKTGDEMHSEPVDDSEGARYTPGADDDTGQELTSRDSSTDSGDDDIGDR